MLFLQKKMRRAWALSMQHSMSLVLEHIPDPKSLLLQLKQHLNIGAVLCIVVPNDFSLIQNYLYNEKSYDAWWVAAPHHINYFTHRSLVKLLKCCGFSIRHVASSFPIDMALLMGFNYTNDDKLGKMCHSVRMKFEHALEKAKLYDFQKDFYAICAKHGLGREAIVYATLD